MARTPEQLAWDAFKRASNSAKFDLHRIENVVGTGTPDVIGINRLGTAFWLENKALVEWPKRASTVALRNKFEPGQLPFARRWNLLLGHSLVLLRAENVFYLLKEIHDLDGKSLDELNKSELIDSALSIGIKNVIEYLENLK